MPIAAIILAFTYVGIAFTRLPRVNIDRPAAALTGAVAMVLLGVLTFEDAVAHIDFDTLALLMGMMLLAGVLKRGGFFTLLASGSASVAGTPARLMVMVVVATAVASAILVNDVVVLLFTPVVIQASMAQQLNPVPYLIGEAMASNIGSTATIVGNPQNMLIGVSSGISFARFFVHLAPIAVVATVILLAVLWLFYRNKIVPVSGAIPGKSTSPHDATGAARPVEIVPVDRKVLWRSTPILILAVVAFFLSTTFGLEVSVIALVAGAAAMLFSGTRPSDIIRDVDWVLMVFFVGLFVVIGGARDAGVLDVFLERVDLVPGVGSIVSIHLFSATVSQIVSNVPLTILLLPLLETVPGDVLWLSLAAGATLGGNATILGAVANIIVAEQAHREGVTMGFVEFLKVGLVVTVLTVAASVGILALQYEMGWMG